MNSYLLGGALVAFIACAAPAAAQSNGKVLLSVRHPYWEVGMLDPSLSTECSRGNFNQVQADKLKIVFNGPVGAAVLGVATDTYNLHDPRKHATPGTSYFFFRDRTGGCEVYRFAKGDEKKKQGALPMDANPYRFAIEDSYNGWKVDESVKNRPKLD